MGPIGRVVPDREVRRLDTLEGMVHEGMWTVDPLFFMHSTVHCSVTLGSEKKGKPPKPIARSFKAPDNCPNHKHWVTTMVPCEPRAEEKGLVPIFFLEQSGDLR
jgi:hypothetical protein